MDQSTLRSIKNKKRRERRKAKKLEANNLLQKETNGHPENRDAPKDNNKAFSKQFPEFPADSLDFLVVNQTQKKNDDTAELTLLLNDVLSVSAPLPELSAECLDFWVPVTNEDSFNSNGLDDIDKKCVTGQEQQPKNEKKKKSHGKP